MAADCILSSVMNISDSPISIELLEDRAHKRQREKQIF
jgi:hypothetical protein